jgi:two-component sensor histidine kinase
MALATVVLYAYNNNRKKNKLLSVQKQQIEQSLKEKKYDAEIHHRVKNNLQVVTSLLNLQSHYIEDEKAYSAVQAGRNRVQSMALIHQFLYKDVGNLTSLHIKEYIQELLAHIEDTNRKTGTMITLEQQADDVELDIDTVVPLGLIINELVTNAYKYAFEGKTEGHIRVSFTRQPDTNGYLLRVTDDGNGMMENPLLEKQIPLVTG